MSRGITPAALAARYPVLFHMAEIGSWPTIAQHGLLSTTALLDLFEVKGAKRQALESSHRPDGTSITHPSHGSAVIRDQKPMDDKGLIRALGDGLTPADWYRLLNGMVFFWLDRKRLETLLGAKAYRSKRQTVLTISTARLLARHADRVMLSPINSGCTKPFPHPRGRDTFLPLDQYPFETWDQKRRGRDAVVELTVKHSVPDIKDVVTRVEEVGAGQQGILLWEET